MNESRFLFDLDIIVLNLLNEGRKTYSLYKMCVLTLTILLALRSTCFSYKAVREDCLKPVILLLIFTTRCNLFLTLWLADVPKPTCKRKCQNTLYTSTLYAFRKFTRLVSSYTNYRNVPESCSPLRTVSHIVQAMTLCVNHEPDDFIFSYFLILLTHFKIMFALRLSGEA